jgi:hypothetical protein
LREERRATLRLRLAATGPSDRDLVDRLKQASFSIETWTVSYARAAAERNVECVLRWQGLPNETLPPPLWNELLEDSDLEHLSWSAVAGDL